MTWAEIEDANDPRDLQFTPAQVLERAAERGDLLAALLDPGRAARLPSAGVSPL